MARPQSESMPHTDTLPRVPIAQLSTAGAVVLFSGTTLSNMIFGAATIIAPSVAADMGADAGAAGLFVALFSAGFAAVLVLAGRLGDRYGRRMLFRVGLALLCVASGAVALAPSLGSLLALRVVEGVATGVMLPQSLSTIHTTSTGRRRVLLTSVYVAVVGLGTTIGQIGAGLLATLGPDAWRLTFAAVGVIALLVLCASGLIVETRTGSASGADVIGTVLLAVAVVAVVVPIGLGRSLGWPWWTWASLLIAAAAVAALARREPRLPQHAALIPLAAIRSRPLRTGLALTAMFFVGYGAFVLLFSSTFGGAVGLSPLTVAIALCPFALAFVTGTLCSPLLVERFSAVPLMRASALVQFACLAAFSVIVWAEWPSPSLLALQPVLLVLGVAQALMYTPLLGTVMGALPRELTGTASGLVSTVQQIGLAVGVAVIAVLADTFSSLGGAGVACCVGLGLVLAVGFALLVGRLRHPAGSPGSAG